MARPTTLNLDDYLPYLINRVGTAMAASFETEALGRFELSIVMWRVLVALSDHGGQRLTDLSAMTSVDVSTLSRMVKRLAARDLVTRTRSPINEREITVDLTPDGAAALADLIPTAVAFEDLAIAGLSIDEVEILKRALRHMHKNLRNR
jgi:DNA-binding MarR family transcriptional regulator